MDPKKAVESPEDWVVIDSVKHPDHIPRPAIDVLLLKTLDPKEAEGRKPISISGERISHPNWDGLNWVCQRKYLPKTAEVVTIPARLFIKKTSAVCYWSVTHPGDAYRELLPDGNGGWKIEVSI